VLLSHYRAMGAQLCSSHWRKGHSTYPSHSLSANTRTTKTKLHSEATLDRCTLTRSAASHLYFLD
jgi:hypothetical protein